MENEEKKNTKKTGATKKTTTSKKTTSAKKVVEKKEMEKAVVEKKEVDVKKEVPKKEEVKKVKVSSVSTDKVVIFIIVGACVLISLLVFGFVFYKSNYEAVVKTEYGIVNKSEYTVYYKMFAPMLQYYGYTNSQIPEVIANKAGTDKVILAKAKELGVTLRSEDATEIEEVFSDSEQVTKWKESGINISILRKLYEEDYIISAYIEKLAENATTEEMINYLKSTYGDDADMYEYNTSHMLIKTTKTDESGNSTTMNDTEKASALSKAQTLLARANSGEDFATLAKENSEDTGTATEGGKFTFYDGDSVLEEYKKAALSLSDGQIYNGIVETTAGYHIIKLDSKVENGRANSSSERKYYANEIVNKYSSTEKIEINTDVLNKLIETITGVKADDTTSEGSDETDNITDNVTTSVE